MKLFLIISALFAMTACSTTQHSDSVSSSAETSRVPAATKDCGPHPFFPGEEPNVLFSKHGFVLNSIHEDDNGFYALATHFSNNTPRHYFNAMIKVRLDRNEYNAAKAALKEHPGASKPHGKFAPFLFMTSRPIRGRAPNEDYGFCMKDFPELVAGKKRSLYKSKKFEDDNLYGNLRKWNPEIRGVFARYQLTDHDPVITFEPGDIEIIFYDAFGKFD